MVTWNQATPPPLGVAYGWAGEPHASESIKYVDGVEVARNLVSNPSFEVTSRSTDRAISSGWESDTLVRGIWAIHGDNSWGLVAGATANQFNYFGKNVTASGSWIAFNTTIQASSAGGGGTRYFAARVGSRVPGLGSYEYGDYFPVVAAAPRDVVEVGGSYKLPDGHSQVQVVVYVYSQEDRRAGPEAGWIVRTDGFHVASADTEAGALAQVEEYFDGSFEDDREGDIWVNPSTGAFHSWGGGSRGWVARDDDKANHPLSDNRLDTSYLVNPVHGGSVEPHRVFMDSSGWSHPDGDAARAYVDIYADESYPMVLPSVRLVLAEGTSKLTDGRAFVARLHPTPGSHWTEGAPSAHFIRVTPGEEVAFRCAVNYSWQDTLMYRDRGIVAGIVFADSRGSWFSSHYSAPVPAVRILDPGALLEQVATVPEGAAWAYILIGVDAPAQTRTGNGSLYLTDLYFGTTNPSRSGASEVGVATVDRRGLVGETFARSREKINIQLAEPDERLKGGERIELAAFAASSSEVTWRWRQVTGPEVLLIREGNTCHFQAPDVDSLTDMRIAVSASSVDGANRSDWHYFDLEIRPAAGRFAEEGSDGFLPYTPQMVGYNRGKREIWNDVIAPVGMDPEGRKEPKLVDLGIPADDVAFILDGEEPARASAGAVYVDIQDGAIYRNFGGGYNETDDTTGAPRLNAYMVNPATGEVFEWEEGSDDGR